MPVTTIEPNGVSTDWSNSAVITGAASEQAALNDDSDTSYLRRAGSGDSRFIGLTLDDPTITAGNDILFVHPRLRYKVAATYKEAPRCYLALAETLGYFVQGQYSQTSITTATGSNVSSGSYGPGGVLWDTTNINSLLLVLQDVNTGSSAGYVYEAEALVTSHARPTTSVTVADTTSTNTIDIPFSVALVVDSAFSGSSVTAAYEVRVFTDDVYNSPGFDAATAPAVYETSGTTALAYSDGVATTTNNITVTTTALPNDTYKAYVRAKLDYPSANYSSWANDAFTINTAPPSISSVSAGTDNTNQRVRISVDAADSTPSASTPTVDIQRRIDVARDEFAGDTLSGIWTLATAGAPTKTFSGSALTISSVGATTNGFILQKRDPITLAETHTYSALITVNSIDTQAVSVMTLLDADAAVPPTSGTTLTTVPSTSTSDAAAVDYPNRLRCELVDSSGLKLRVVRSVASGSAASQYWTGSTWGASTYLTMEYATEYRFTLDTTVTTWRLRIVKTADSTVIVDTGVQALADLRTFFFGARLAVMGEIRDDGHTASLAIAEYYEHADEWEDVVTDAPVTYGVSYIPSDYTSPRGKVATYRTRVTGIVAGAPLTSAWTEFTADVPVSESGWNIKVPSDPSLNIIGALVLKDPDYKQDEDLTVFRPINRTYPVVVAGSLGGADGTLAIEATTAAEWAALQALRDYQGSLYLESPFGWGRWIRFVSRSWAEMGAAAYGRRRMQVDFVEVEG